MFTFAPVCAQLSWWCLNSLFYRILTHIDQLPIYLELLVEPESPPAGPWPSTGCWYQSAPYEERQRPVRPKLPLSQSTQETEHESLHVSICSMTLDLTVLLDIYLLNWYLFVFLFISLRRVFPTLVYTRNSGPTLHILSFPGGCRHPLSLGSRWVGTSYFLDFQRNDMKIYAS